MTYVELMYKTFKPIYIKTIFVSVFNESKKITKYNTYFNLIKTPNVRQSFLLPYFS